MESVTYKIIMMGNAYVGKTSIIKSVFMGSNVFNNSENSTIGASFYTKHVKLNNTTIKLDFWDTAGQERFGSLMKLYYRDADIVILVFDMANYEHTLNKCMELMKDIENINNSARFMLAGNKVDLVTDDKKKTIDKYIDDKIGKNIKVISRLFTSAKVNTNIDDLYEAVLDHVKNMYKYSAKTKKQNIIMNDDKVNGQWRLGWLASSC